MSELQSNQFRKTFLNMSFVYVINLFHFVGFLLPYPLRIWFFSILVRKIGRGTSIDNRVYFKFPWLVEIGKGVSINRGVEFYSDFFGKRKIIIEDNVRIGPNARFHASGHDVDDPTLNRHVGGEIRVKRGAWVGAAAIVLPGVTIGENAVVAAGAIVTKDVADQTIVGGNPAKPIRMRK